MRQVLLSAFAFFIVCIVHAQPTITSLSPVQGNVGSTVTITGTNFNVTAANNIVYFGAVKATVGTASATSLTVTVPAGATFGPVTVLNTSTSLAAYSLQNFSPTFSPNKSTIGISDFEAGVNFTTDYYPQTIAIGDLDGDGKPDMVTTNNLANNASIFLNNGNGGLSFATKIDLTTSYTPIGVALGDINSDGKLDIVIANSNAGTGVGLDGNSVSVFRNISTVGNVSFAGRVNFGTGTSPLSVAIADLNGDGLLDIVTANGGSGNISVLQHVGVGATINFALKADFAGRAEPTQVVVGDIDGDGKPDLAVVNNEGDASGAISVYRNTSTTNVSFAAKVDLTAGQNTRGIAIGDIDGDGKLDLAATNWWSSSLSVLKNNSTAGTISFGTKVDFSTLTTSTSSSPYSPNIADLNGDGKLDIALVNAGSGTISIFRNNSTSGSISLATRLDLTTLSGVTTMAIGDLDGDAKPDLAVANTYSSNLVSILKNISLSNAKLNSLTISSGTLNPVFATGTISYSVTVNNSVSSVTVTPTQSDAGAIIQVRVNGGSYATVTSGTASSSLALNIGNNPIDVKVTAQDGTTIKTYTITVNKQAAVPVVITSLKASQNNGGIDVEWSVTKEINVASYEVEKSTDGQQFSKIASVKAIGSLKYNLIDLLPNNASNYYRIKIIDKGGTFQYSQVVNVRIGSINSMVSVTPNPVKGGMLLLKLENLIQGNYTIVLHNSLGQQLFSKKVAHAGGSATQSLNIGSLPIGTYQMMVVSGANTIANKTIMVE